MCHGTYSPIPDPSKNWSVKKVCKYILSRSLRKQNIPFLYLDFKSKTEQQNWVYVFVKTKLTKNIFISSFIC